MSQDLVRERAGITPTTHVEYGIEYDMPDGTRYVTEWPSLDVARRYAEDAFSPEDRPAIVSRTIGGTVTEWTEVQE